MTKIIEIVSKDEFVVIFRFKLLVSISKKISNKVWYEIRKFISFNKKKYQQYEIKIELKDWEIAKKMFGKNEKKDCEIIKKMRKHYQIVYHSEGWCLIWNTNINDEIGWLIPDECLTIKK